MSLLNNEMLLGESSPFSQPCSVAEESLGLLDDYLEVAEPLGSHGFSSDKAKAVSSNWLAVDSLGNTIDSSQEDAFSGMEWMVEKMDLKEFDFDALLGMEHLEATVSPDELMATLEDTCDLLFNPTTQEFHNKEPPLIPDLITNLPESPIGADPMAPLSSLWSFPLSPGSLTSVPDHSFSLELGSEVDVLEGERKQEGPTFLVVITKSEKEEENHSDDSGICMSPDSYLGTPQHSPTNSLGSPNDNPFPTDAACGSVRSKPYDHPAEKVASAKVKGEKKIDKKLKKMEQNKTAATRYRQKKRAEQEALSGECRDLEQKNQALKEKADSLSKEIQYLKDLIEEDAWLMSQSWEESQQPDELSLPGLQLRRREMLSSRSEGCGMQHLCSQSGNLPGWRLSRKRNYGSCSLLNPSSFFCEAAKPGCEQATERWHMKLR